MSPVYININIFANYVKEDNHGNACLDYAIASLAFLKWKPVISYTLRDPGFAEPLLSGSTVFVIKFTSPSTWLALNDSFVPPS